MSNERNITFLCGQCCDSFGVGEKLTLGWFTETCEACNTECEIKNHGGAGFVRKLNFKQQEEFLTAYLQKPVEKNWADGEFATPEDLAILDATLYRKRLRDRLELIKSVYSRCCSEWEWAGRNPEEMFSDLDEVVNAIDHHGDVDYSISGKFASYSRTPTSRQ